MATILLPVAMTQPSISGMVVDRRPFSSIAIIPLESMPWHGLLMAHVSPPAPGITSYECGMCSPQLLFSPIAVTPIGSIRWHGHLMVGTSFLEAVIRRYRCG